MEWSSRLEWRVESRELTEFTFDSVCVWKKYLTSGTNSMSMHAFSTYSTTYYLYLSSTHSTVERNSQRRFALHEPQYFVPVVLKPEKDHQALRFLELRSKFYSCLKFFKQFYKFFIKNNSLFNF